jgi:hypothetical protein
MERANRQTGFLPIWCWIHSKEEDEKGWDECMNEMCDMSDGWMQIVSFSSTPFG